MAKITHKVKVVPLKPKLFKHFIQLQDIASNFNFNPFLWVNISGHSSFNYRIFVKSQNWQIWICSFCGFINSLYAVLMWIDLMYSFPDYIHEGRIHEGSLQITAAICYTTILICFVHVLYYKNETIYAVNATFRIFNDGTGSVMERQNIFLAWKKIDKLSTLIQCSAIGVLLFHGITFWVFPHYRIFLFAFFPLSWKKILWVKIIMTFYELGFQFIGWCLFIPDFTLCSLCIQTISSALGALTRNVRKSKIKSNIARYQQLRLLNTLFYNGFGKMYLPGLTVTVLGVLLTTISAGIVIYKLIGAHAIGLLVVLAVAGVVIMGMLLETAGNVGMYSNQVLEEFKRIHCSRRLRPLFKSCKPFGIVLGPLKAISRRAPLEVLDFLLSTLTSILITIADF